MEEQKLCTTDGCGKPASKLACPQCKKFFCSQECFKAFWATHKKSHAPAAAPAKKPESSAENDERREMFAGFGFTGSLRPADITPRRTVPAEIPRPEYADDGEPKIENQFRGGTSIEVRTAEEIQIMREVCRMARDVLDMAGRMVAPGVTTDEIDRAVHEDIIRRGAYPSPLNYRGFPKSCCTSVNEVVCHGIPDLRPLEDGDIVNIDITVYYKGFHGDVNDTFFCGTIKPNALRLVKATYECLDNAIKQTVKPGRLYRDVGQVISKHATLNGFSVIRSYCGHGIGRLFHTAPNVPHYSKNKAVGIMKPGHVFTIEPMINEGVYKDTLWPDDWTSVTRDGKLSAQFEHTILVTEDGYEILTARTENSYVYPWMKK